LGGVGPVGVLGGGGGREVLLTITKWLNVGKHNALSGDVAPGRMGSSIDGEYSTPTLRLAMWHEICLSADFVVYFGVAHWRSASTSSTASCFEPSPRPPVPSPPPFSRIRVKELFGFSTLPFPSPSLATLLLLLLRIQPTDTLK